MSPEPKVSKAYMAIIGDGRGGIFCEDALAEPKDWHADTKAAIKLGTFDVVVTNPPFGSRPNLSGGRSARVNFPRTSLTRLASDIWRYGFRFLVMWLSANLYQTL